MPEDNTVSRRTLLQGIGAGTAAGAVGTDLVAAASGPSGGSDAHWTTGEQYGVGTVADHGSDDPSRVWFTLTKGALASVRFPRADLMNLRTLDFLVTDGEGYAERTFEVDRTSDDPVERRVEPADGALAYRQTATVPDRGWGLTVEYVAHPDHDSVVADVSFTSRGSTMYDIYALADLALSNSGMADSARVAGSGSEGVLAAHDTGANDGQAVVLDEDGEPYNVATALGDRWQANTEAWMATTTGTDSHTKTPYYFRINDDRDPDDGARRSINNGGPTLDERDVIDAGFLELVRLGVKPHDDPTIRNSLAVVYDTIRVETPNGPCASIGTTATATANRTAPGTTQPAHRGRSTTPGRAGSGRSSPANAPSTNCSRATRTPTRFSTRCRRSRTRAA